MSHFRMARVAEEIKRELAQMIRDEIKDPRVKGLISVTHVEVTNDFKNAKIFVSMLADEEQIKNALRGLDNASGYLRSELAKKLQLRFTPELVFKFDQSLAYGDKINKIISTFTHDEGVD